MNAKDSLDKSISIVVHDILTFAQVNEFLASYSSDKYPSYFFNTEGNFYLTEGLEILIANLRLNQISIIGRLLDSTKNTTSVNKVTKRIQKQYKPKKTDELDKLYKKICESPIRKKLKDTRNEIVAHNATSSKCKEDYASFSDITKLQPLLIEWAKLVVEIADFNNKDENSYLSPSQIQYVLEKRFPSSAKAVFDRLLL